MSFLKSTLLVCIVLSSSCDFLYAQTDMSDVHLVSEEDHLHNEESEFLLTEVRALTLSGEYCVTGDEPSCPVVEYYDPCYPILGCKMVNSE